MLKVLLHIHSCKSGLRDSFRSVSHLVSGSVAVGETGDGRLVVTMLIRDTLDGAVV